MVKRLIGYQKTIYDKIVLFLITKYAYKGYCYYVKLDTTRPDLTPLSYLKFKGFSEWQIRFSYMVYIERVLGIRVIRKNTLSPYRNNSEILKWLWLQIKHFLKLI